MNLINLKSKKFYCVAGIGNAFYSKKRNKVHKLICFELEHEINGQRLLFKEKVKIDKMISHIKTLNHNKVKTFVTTNLNVRLQDIFYLNDRNYPEFIDNLGRYHIAPILLTEKSEKKIALHHFIITHVGASFKKGKYIYTNTTLRNFNLDIIYHASSRYKSEIGDIFKVTDGKIIPFDLEKNDKKKIINIPYNKPYGEEYIYERSRTKIPPIEIVANRLIWQDEQIISMLNSKNIFEKKKLKRIQVKKREFIYDILSKTYNQNIKKEDRDKMFKLLIKEIEDIDIIKNSDLFSEKYLTKEEFKNWAGNHESKKLNQKISKNNSHRKEPNPLNTYKLLNEFFRDNSLLKTLTHSFDYDGSKLQEIIKKARQKLVKAFPDIDEVDLDLIDSKNDLSIKSRETHGIHLHTHHNIATLITSFLHKKYTFDGHEITPWELIKSGENIFKPDFPDFGFNNEAIKFKEKYRPKEGLLIDKITDEFKKILIEDEYELVFTNKTQRIIKNNLLVWIEDLSNFFRFIFSQIKDHSNYLMWENEDPRIPQRKKIYIIAEKKDVDDNPREKDVVIKILDDMSITDTDLTDAKQIEKYFRSFQPSKVDHQLDYIKGLLYFSIITPIKPDKRNFESRAEAVKYYDQPKRSAKIDFLMSKKNYSSDREDLIKHIPLMEYDNDLLEKNGLKDEEIGVGFTYILTFPITDEFTEKYDEDGLDFR